MERSTRCLYLFLDPLGRYLDATDPSFGAGRQTVKLGLVLAPDRVARRLNEVARHKTVGREGLLLVAQTPLEETNHAEAEHIEAVARHWLCKARGFEHAHLVDWLIVPEQPPHDWQVLLDEAVRAAQSFGVGR